MEAEKAKTAALAVGAEEVSAITAAAAEAAATTTTTGTTNIPAAAAKDTKEDAAAVEMKDIGKRSTTTTPTTPYEASNQALPEKKINVEIPIISLSDGEDVIETTPSPMTKGGVKKRKSMEGVAGLEAGGAEASEEHFRLKRRKIKVAGAPKMPLTGYVRYMNDRRESLRKEYPTKTAIEHTKIIGEEWQALAEERKTPYMKAAEVDKQRYLSELHVFLKARPDVLACELAKNKQRRSAPVADSKSVLKEKSQVNGASHTKQPFKDFPVPRRSSEPEVVSPPAAAALPIAVQPHAEKPKRKRTPTPPNSIFAAPVPGEIPIFTNEFLEHNKVFDMELRTLRKSKADLEQQNAVLEKHVENMKFGVEKMTNENDELQEKNRLLEIYLEKLKRKLAHALAGLSIPSEPHGATLGNIDKYMNDLYKMATTNTHGPASLNKAKDIIRKLDLQIHL